MAACVYKGCDWIGHKFQDPCTGNFLEFPVKVDGCYIADNSFKVSPR